MSRVVFSTVAALVAASFLSIGGVSQAQSPSRAAGGLTGLDKLHQQARIGGKLCMTSHEHAGEGSLPSRRGAEAAAIRHWEGFTAWEYGKPWGSYGLAVGRKMECSNSGSAWACSTRARPCRSAGR